MAVPWPEDFSLLVAPGTWNWIIPIDVDTRPTPFGKIQHNPMSIHAISGPRDKEKGIGKGMSGRRRVYLMDLP